MPWYYAGPEAKPVGPVTLDELHALSAKGTVLAETYVIEHAGPSAAPGTWKRYRELFPATTPPPPVAPPPFVPPPTPSTPQPSLQSHPLFPSAGMAPTQHSVFAPSVRPDPYHKARSTNGLCAWGFGLGLAGLIFSFALGVGILPALAAILLCIIGLVQVHHHHGQSGQGLAIAGLLLAVLAVIISLIFILAVDVPFIKAHAQTATEQSPNDSD
jgi:hypothetical protein